MNHGPATMVQSVQGELLAGVATPLHTRPLLSCTW